MKNKKLLALGLATVMAASAMVVPAMAESKSQTVNINGTTNAATIKVTIAGSKKVVLNPYQMQYKVDATTTVEDKVVSTDNSIINKSGVPLKVSFKVSPSITGDMKLSPKKLTSNDTTKKAYLVFGIQDGSVSGKKVTKAAAWGKDNTTEKKVVVVEDADKDSRDAKDELYYLKAGDAKNPSGAAFAIYGDIVGSPKKTGSDGKAEDDGWTKQDKVKTTIEFTFYALGTKDTATSVYGGGSTSTTA